MNRVRSRWRFWARNAPVSCRQVGKAIQSYLDGELDAADISSITEHLDACRECGLEASTFERIKAALAQPSPEEIDPTAIERLRTFSAQLTED